MIKKFRESSTEIVLASFFVLVALGLTGPTIVHAGEIPPVVDPTCPESRLALEIAGPRGFGASFTISPSGDEATVRFMLKPGCVDVPVTVASFQRQVPGVLLPQTLIDKATGVFSAGVEHTLTVSLPPCEMQTDLIWGVFNDTELNSSNFFDVDARAQDWIYNVIPCVPSTTGTINVVKTLINDNGRTLTVEDFPLFINGEPVISGVTNTFQAPGTYTVTETSNSNYTSTFSGDCNANGIINLSPSQNLICVITNDDIPPSDGGGGPAPVPPLIDVLKVPNPLSLPNGPGSVTYTYTVSNIGTVPMTSVIMVGDSCSPIVLQSGDTNSNDVLDLTEIWVYTCTTTLTATHTNTVTATGIANGLTTVDTASATVVVGSGGGGGGGSGGSNVVGGGTVVGGVPGFPNTGLVVPPMIHVTKVPDPMRLPVGGGRVTYTYRITNPGTEAITNIELTDDKCTAILGHSGDVNNDDMLDISETWTYTCSTNLFITTTNTAIASVDAKGLTVRDFAIATVVVPGTVAVVPGLPNTGLPPQEKSPPWNILIPIGISVALFLNQSRKKLIINS